MELPVSVACNMWHGYDILVSTNLSSCVESFKSRNRSAVLSNCALNVWNIQNSNGRNWERPQSDVKGQEVSVYHGRILKEFCDRWQCINVQHMFVLY